MTNLRSVDLNLLVVLDALYLERSVTSAGERLGMSQPAVSHALNRLRTMFEDPLFCRTGSGLEPTPRAIAVAGALAPLLADVGEVVSAAPPFDPRRSAREFTLRASDLLSRLVLAPLVERLRAKAPGVALKLVHLTPDETVDALNRAAIDVALSTGLNITEAIVGEQLMSDRMVLVTVREGTRPISSLEDFMTLSFVRVAISPTDRRFVDDVLSARGLERTVALTVPHWLVVPEIVLSGRLAAVMSERLARKICGPEHRLQPLPFEHSPFMWCLYTATRSRHDRGIVWLKEQIRAASRAPAPPASEDRT